MTKIHQEKSGATHTHTNTHTHTQKKQSPVIKSVVPECFSCGVFVLTPQPQVTLIAGSFALFNVSLTVHTRGYWYQRPVNICSCNAGQKGCRLHWLHTASLTPLQSRKMTQPWLQKVTRMIAPVDLNQTSAHDYLSEGCMRHVGNVFRNEWYFLVMLWHH